jgi:hypothetical protein
MGVTLSTLTSTQQWPAATINEATLCSLTTSESLSTNLRPLQLHLLKSGRASFHQQIDVRLYQPKRSWLCCSLRFHYGFSHNRCHTELLMICAIFLSPVARHSKIAIGSNIFFNMKQTVILVLLIISFFHESWLTKTLTQNAFVAWRQYLVGSGPVRESTRSDTSIRLQSLVK